MENPIKMDDLGVSLFQETTNWMILDIIDISAIRGDHGVINQLIRGCVFCINSYRGDLTYAESERKPHDPSGRGNMEKPLSMRVDRRDNTYEHAIFPYHIWLPEGNSTTILNSSYPLVD